MPNVADSTDRSHVSDGLNRTNVTDWLRRAARRTGYPRYDCAAVVTEQSVIEIADVMSSNVVHGVVVQPADHPALQVADGVVVLIPGDDLALRSVDRFHTRTLWTIADTAMRVIQPTDPCGFARKPVLYCDADVVSNRGCAAPGLRVTFEIRYGIPHARVVLIDIEAKRPQP